MMEEDTTDTQSQCVVSDWEMADPLCNQTDGNRTLLTLVEPNLWCLALVLFPIACIFGNILVVMAVLSERTLKTSTNFLLVSLACADLLVGTLVMPFSIYLTINRLQWYLPEALCNFFCVVDVSASTSSIVHLVAISIDRFYAVVRHMEYKSPKHKRRVYGTIIFSWIFSIGIGLPLGIGLNHGRASKDEYECGIVNPDYMLYSSVFAFYIPCLVMAIMYSFVFYRLHRRMRSVKLQEMAAGQMVQFGDNLGNILQGAYGNKDNLRQASLIWAIPFLKTLEATIAENDDMSTEELDELTTILHTLESDPQHRAIIERMEDIPESPENSHGGTPVPADRLLSPRNHARRQSRLVAILNRMSSKKRRKRRQGKTRGSGGSSTSSRRSGLAGILASMTGGNGGNNSDGDNMSDISGSGRSKSDSERRRRQSLYVAKQKIKTLKDRAIELLVKLKSKQGMVIRKETRATKLVSTVMLVFLLCWTPFFTLNVVKVFKLRTDTWTYELESLFIFFTWLGYLNSCLNPIIYSLFNRKFRATFQKLLHCLNEDNESPLHRQRRLYSRPFAGDTFAPENTEAKKTWRALAHRLSMRGPRTHKTGLVHQRGLNAPRNGALVLTKSCPAGEPPTQIVPNVREADAGEVVKQSTITWKLDSSGHKISVTEVTDVTSPRRPTIIENTVLRSPETKTKLRSPDVEQGQDGGENQQNGSDGSILRRMQSLHCSDQSLADQSLEFTEPVEV